MKYGSVPGIDTPLSRIVQGTVMLHSGDIDGGFALLDAVYEAGGTAFDTAHGYRRGDCERVLGQWVAERGLRDKVVIIGKGAHPYEGRIRVTPADIASDLAESLERLQVETIDLYLLHRDDVNVPVGPLVEVLDESLRAGKIRAYGGSNWTPERIAEANAYAAEHGLAPFVASSPNVSLAEQQQAPWEGCLSISGEAGRAAREWYAAQNMPIFSWSSLAGGFFSGRFSRDNVGSFEDGADQLCAATYGTPANFDRLDRARQMAGEKGVTVSQIALAYVLNLPLNIFALVGCQTGAEFRENAVAADIELTPDELTWLERG